MRIDIFLKEKFPSRTKAMEAIEKGQVLLNGKVCKPSDNYKEGDKVEIIKPDELYVSNGGYKLGKALKDFSANVEGMTFIDVGASNGGFTDCLLQCGAKKVYAIDVGKTQLEEILKKDNRVVVMDNTNARFLKKEDFCEEIEGSVIDVSFISLTLILPAVAGVLKDNGVIYSLIKPQFECGKKQLNKNGIVTEFAVRKEVVKRIITFALSLNLETQNITYAPIKEGKNVEYVVMFQKKKDAKDNIKQILIKLDNLHK